MLHQPIVAGAIALMSAQTLKLLTHMLTARRFDFRRAVGTGGMPSSHTALVVALTTTVGYVAGFGSTVFDVAVVFSAIVMYDATGVRRAAGRQAAVLNKIMEDLATTLTFKEQRLKELLGHTRLEVLGGVAHGVLVAWLVERAWGG